jgi:ABC-type lipoprotein release transport system permease subunit
MPPMTWTTVGLIGAGLNVIGALLLVVVISPGRKRYEHITGAHLGRSPPMLRFIRDQTRAGAVVLIGTTLQLLAALFAR